MVFLIEYDRKRGEIVTIQPFADTQKLEADSMRLARELELNRSGIEHEIVILDAENEEALRRTHRRYFESLEDFARAS